MHNEPDPAATAAAAGQAGDALDSKTLQELRHLQEEYGNPHFVVELVQLFLSNAPRRLDQIRDAVARADGQALENVAHTLKSNCAMLGASRLASMCADLERLGEAGALAETSRILQHVEAEFVKVQRALEQIRKG